MKVLSRTHVGNIREINEDSFLIQENEKGHTLYVIADGMGGHNAGEVASSIAVQVLNEEFLKANYNSPKEFLKEAILKANTVIYSNSLTNEAYSKMGTTLSAMVIIGNIVFIGHVGDSRIYYFNKIISDKYRQLTKDHTMVQMLYEQGHIKQEELATHPYRNILAQSLGTSKKLKADILEMKVPNSGYFLMCSDGLTDELTDEELKDFIMTVNDLGTKADKIINAALNNKGKDNITFIIIER
ncbi:MAG: Stp1/IreP family PP2C-type Ser/Thr phosphatase [Mycoplasmatales bacterium]